jgi:predicted N-acyltransferase
LPRIEIVKSLAAVDPRSWDALTGDDDPFVEHAFLRGLETSGSVGEGTGWSPLHVLAWEGTELAGALALYEKEHSWGEFIFDFGWARAAERAGIRYYPKLVSMAPFTPATGRRFLIAEGRDPKVVIGALIDGAKTAAERARASSVHFLFLTQEERDLAIEHGLSARLSMQFHWENEGYRTFDDYLARFRADKRKQVKRERRRVAESGVSIAVKEGPSLDAREWAALARFYREGVARHGSYPYLTREFFAALRETHAPRVVAAFAYRGELPIAASLSFEKGKRLYGRYWGCTESIEGLHFELCYYRLIERAIERGLAHFEAGAQGFHKIKRGMLPSEVHSAHWVAEPRLRAAVEAFLPEEAREVGEELRMIGERSPLHRGPV